MDSKTIRIGQNELQIVLEQYLLDANKEENERIFKCMKEAGKFAKRRVSELSPVSTGKYAQGWRMRTKRRKGRIETVIFNETEPGLTHLLEESHIVRNQWGKYERTNPEAGRGGKVHIKPAREEAEEYLMELLTSGWGY